MLLGDQGDPLRHPRVDDGLTGLPLQMAEHGGDRYPRPRHHGRGVRVDQRGQLIAVRAAEGAYLDGRHGGPSIQSGKVERMGRYRCGTPAQ
jgi:hypothetical protein